MTVSASGTDLGDGTIVYWASVAGHTLAAQWNITSAGATSASVRCVMLHCAS